MTEIEVIDSAIKIGLGAFIAGFFSWLNAHVSHNRAVSKEYGEYTREIYRKYVRSSEALYVKQADYLETLVIFNMAASNAVTPPIALHDKVQSSYADLHTSVQDIILAGADLKTLLDDEVVSAAKKYIEYIGDFIESTYDPITLVPTGNVNRAILLTYSQQLQNHRQRFLVVVGNAIKRSFK